MIRSDNGMEFFCLKPYFLEHGILRETSIVGTPQQNGRVEIKHRHILYMARALLFQLNLPKIFWGECVLTPVYLIKRTFSKFLHKKTPYKLFHGITRTYSHLMSFGCLAS